MSKTVYLVNVWSLGCPHTQNFLFYNRKEAVKKIRLLLNDPLVDHIVFDKQFMELV